MTMIGPFHPWRDTLQDLGVMGLIPVPVQREAVLENRLAAHYEPIRA